MPRLFVAIDLPDTHKDQLAALKDPMLSVRWTPHAQYHLTLRFIGSVDADTQATIEQALASISASPFVLEGQGLGVFPSVRRPRVLFAGIKPTTDLLDLHQDLNHALGQVGMTPDSKGFRPHVTLARVKTAGVSEIRTYLHTHESITLAPFAVSRFHLYESILRPEGALHVQRRTFDFSESA